MFPRLYKYGELDLYGVGSIFPKRLESCFLVLHGKATVQYVGLVSGTWIEKRTTPSNLLAIQGLKVMEWPTEIVEAGEIFYFSCRNEID